MSPEQHSNDVHYKLIQSIMALNKSHKKKILKRMADALHKLATSQEVAPIQRMPEAETEQETEPFQRVSLAPLSQLQQIQQQEPRCKQGCVLTFVLYGTIPLARFLSSQHKNNPQGNHLASTLASMHRSWHL